MKQPVYFKPDSSFTDLSYTYAFDKYSCVSWMYPLHIIFAYLIVISGLLAVLSRVIKKLTPFHADFGRWYIIFMLWGMASSLLIHNNGLPFPILVSFLYLLVSISIGWNAIRTHMKRVGHQVNVRVQAKIEKLLNSNSRINLREITEDEKMQFSKAQTFKQRFFSYRMAHGIFMSFSWCQMLGRTVVTNPFTSFHGCWTYPAYKSNSLQNPVYAVDGKSTPPFPMENGKFIIMITVPTVIIILSTALVSTYFLYKADRKEMIKDFSATSEGSMIR